MASEAFRTDTDSCGSWSTWNWLYYCWGSQLYDRKEEDNNTLTLPTGSCPSPPTLLGIATTSPTQQSTTTTKATPIGMEVNTEYMNDGDKKCIGTLSKSSSFSSATTDMEENGVWNEGGIVTMDDPILLSHYEYEQRKEDAEDNQVGEEATLDELNILTNSDMTGDDDDEETINKEDGAHDNQFHMNDEDDDDVDLPMMDEKDGGENGYEIKLGRGPKEGNNPGKLRMNAYITEHIAPHYFLASRNKVGKNERKRTLIVQTIRWVPTDGGRFVLKNRSTGLWDEVVVPNSEEEIVRSRLYNLVRQSIADIVLEWKREPAAEKLNPLQEVTEKPTQYEVLEFKVDKIDEAINVVAI